MSSPTDATNSIQTTTQGGALVHVPRERATNLEKEARITLATELLLQGHGKAEVAQFLVEELGISLRQAQRYTKAATLDVVGDSLSSHELNVGLAMDLHRLDLIAGKYTASGKVSHAKIAIDAIKAKSAIACNRLKAIEAQAQKPVKNWDEMPF